MWYPPAWGECGWALELAAPRGGQAALMEADLGMYWAKTDTPMQFKTSTLNEELGQVEGETAGGEERLPSSRVKLG